MRYRGFESHSLLFFTSRASTLERWPSGRRRTAGIRVYRSAVPWVRIPPSPLLEETPIAFTCSWGVRLLAWHPVRPGREQRTRYRVCAPHKQVKAKKNARRQRRAFFFWFWESLILWQRRLSSWPSLLRSPYESPQKACLSSDHPRSVCR